MVVTARACRLNASLPRVSALSAHRSYWRSYRSIDRFVLTASNCLSLVDLITSARPCARVPNRGTTVMIPLDVYDYAVWCGGDLDGKHSTMWTIICICRLRPIYTISPQLSDLLRHSDLHCVAADIVGNPCYLHSFTNARHGVFESVPFEPYTYLIV